MGDDQRGGDYLRLLRRPEVSASSYEVAASVAGRTAANDSLSVLGAETFVTALQEFERSRTGSAELSGTYDFRLRVESFGGTGAAWVGFQVTESLPPPGGRRGRHLLEGGFVVGGEHVGRMTRDLTATLRGGGEGVLVQARA